MPINKKIKQLEGELKNSPIDVEKIDQLVREFNKSSNGWDVSFKILPKDKYELTFKCYSK
jgi:wobble nucleotide-excising tRNase